MRPLSRTALRATAALLAYLLSVQPALAAVQSVQIRTGSVSGGVSAAGVVSQAVKLSGGSLSLSPFSLQPLSGAALSAAPSVDVSRGLAAPSVSGAVSLSAPAAVEAPRAALAGPAPQAAATVSASVRTLSERTVGPAAQAAAQTVQGLERSSADGSKGVADRQFDILTGERRIGGSSDVADPVAAPQAAAAGGAAGASLQAPTRQQAAAQAEVPPAASAPVAAAKAKGSFTQVFKDPERNKSFWRYVLGNVIFTFGIEMYVVGLPYLVSAFTKNTLSENHDPRAGNAEAVQSLVRENRSLARVAHWTAQAFSYATIPLFTRNTDGSLNWLPRSFWIRSGVLAGVVGLFFASGLFSLPVALYSFLGLIGVQSFFQGLSVTMEGVGMTRMLGDKSVTDAERMKANSILTFLYSAVAIIGPAVAGQISQVKEFLGKSGAGGALIYGIYALCTGISGLIYATVKIFKQKPGAAPAGTAAAPAAAETLGVKGVLKNLVVSLKDGVKLVVKDSFLRTQLILSMLISLFSDPLVFNVLPEYVENLIKANPGAIGAVLNIPGLGWFIKGMTSTPMGFFSLLVVFSSLGSIAGSLLMEPARKLLSKLGFQTEESMTVPLFILSALQIPLFWLMISVPSMWLVLPLYGLQTFLGSFATMVVSGINQKKVGTYSGGDVNKILAAQSFLGIIAAIISTVLYGFVLSNIPIATALLIAAVATTVYGAAQLVAPWLAFSKKERQRTPPQPGS